VSTFARSTLALLLAGLSGGALMAHTRAADAAAAPNAADSRTAALITRAEAEIGDAVPIVERLRADPAVGGLLDRAKAILIVPHFAKGAFLIGGQRGAAVLIARHDGGWTDPAFYSVHGMSLGLQAGAASGALAMLLMSDKALTAFRNNDNTWAVNGRTGLTVIRASEHAPDRVNDSDVIVWRESKGLFGGLAVDALDVTPDDAENHAFYHSPVAPLQILIGAASNRAAEPLRAALLTRVAAD